MTTTQSKAPQSVAHVDTELGTFNVSMKKGYMPSNCRYFADEVKSQINEIVKDDVLVYRLNYPQTITVNRVDYQYIYAKVYLKQQAVYVYGDRIDGQGVLSPTASKKLTAMVDRVLLHHANKHVEKIRTIEKSNVVQYIEEWLNDAALKVKERRKVFIELTAQL